MACKMQEREQIECGKTCVGVSTAARRSARNARFAVAWGGYYEECRPDNSLNR